MSKVKKGPIVIGEHITDKKRLESLMSFFYTEIMESEQRIVEIRKSVLRNQALIKAIKEKGYYENPKQVDWDNQARAWWIRMVGEQNIHWKE